MFQYGWYSAKATTDRSHSPEELIHFREWSPGCTIHCTLLLYDYRRVMGRVLRPDGKPACGAHVVYQGFWQEGDATLCEKSDVIADGEGRFEFTVDREANVVLTAIAAGYRPQSIQLGVLTAVGPDRDVDITVSQLRPTTTFECTIRDPEGRAVAGAVVTIGKHVKDVDDPEHQLNMRSDSNGALTLALSPEETYALVLQHRDFEEVVLQGVNAHKFDASKLRFSQRR